MSKNGPKFKKRRAFNREEVFPKKVAAEKMADEMRLYQNMVISINKAFPNREERMEYIQALIDGLSVEEEEDEELHSGERGRIECTGCEESSDIRSAVEVGGSESEAGEGEDSGQ